MVPGYPKRIFVITILSTLKKSFDKKALKQCFYIGTKVWTSILVLKYGLRGR